MKANKIKSFTIFGLFGESDIHIPFEENIKILIGENGLGKTQVLNIFYYTLTKNFLKLSEFPFVKIELVLDSEKIVITKKEIDLHLENTYKSPLIKDIINEIGVGNYEMLLNESLHSTSVRFKNLINSHPVYSRLRKLAPTDVVFDVLRDDAFLNRHSNKKNNKDLTPNLSDCSEKISKCVSNDIILYFPTFRRVEEDLHNLGYDEEKFFLSKDDNRLIHFGMDDVQKRFDTIEKKIDLLLKEGFTKISSEILSQLVKGFGKTDRDILDRINETDIEIILARVGNQLSEAEKSRIREIVEKKEISDKDNSLFYFLQILVDIYEKQKEFDDSINTFREVCNKYLINKSVIYDESKIKIFIKPNSSDEPLSLNKLSSGEKQIISIFSNVYLSDVERRFLVLFDEPELSLSMSWQKTLLPDILNSKSCDFLLAVTHSPFIFDNQLDKYAIGLNEYVKSIK